MTTDVPGDSSPQPHEARFHSANPEMLLLVQWTSEAPRAPPGVRPGPNAARGRNRTRVSREARRRGPLATDGQALPRVCPPSEHAGWTWTHSRTTGPLGHPKEGQLWGNEKTQRKLVSGSRMALLDKTSLGPTLLPSPSPSGFS